MHQTSKIFSAMLDDLAMDAALQAHHQLLRSRAVCRTCHTRYVISALLTFGIPTGLSAGVAWVCWHFRLSFTITDVLSSPTNLVHPNGAQTVTPQSQSTLHGDVGGKTASSTGTNTPNGSKSDGNIFFECMVCKRQVSTGLI